MKVFVWTMLFWSSYVMVGQQKPQFTQYMLNKYGENPAYGGMDRSLSVFTSYRDQYSVFPGNPKTFYLGADMPVYIWNGAIGFSLFNHQTGVFNNSNLKLSYNYVFGTPYGFLTLGGRLGVDFLSVNGGGIITPDGEYEGVFNHNDPTLEFANFNGTGLSWEIGSYFKGRLIEGGLTISELPSHSYNLGNGQYKRAFVASLFGSYKYTWSEQIEFIPSILLKIDQANLQTDLGIISKINGNLVLGMNLRGYSKSSFDAFSIIVGTNLGKKYNIYYSYDFGLSDLRTFNQGSHEIMLSYNLQKLIGLGLPPKIIYNPRDL